MIRLQNPHPRERSLTFVEFAYKIESRHYLKPPEKQISADFFDVVNRRRSHRSFCELPFESLNALLWNSSRTIEKAAGQTLNRWEHRPAPSAGGRHPIDLFVISRVKSVLKLALYEATPHAIANISTDSGVLNGFYQHVNEILPIGQGSLLWLGAQFNRTLSKYANGESLVWRDAGSLLATISFVAEALELNSCAIGFDGSVFLSECLGTNTVIGVGGLVVGARSADG